MDGEDPGFPLQEHKKIKLNNTPELRATYMLVNILPLSCMSNSLYPLLGLAELLRLALNLIYTLAGLSTGPSASASQVARTIGPPHWAWLK